MNFDPTFTTTTATPLAYAAMKGSLPMVELLLRNGADPMAVTKEGDTRSSWLCAWGMPRSPTR